MISGKPFKLFIDLGGFAAIGLTTKEMATAEVHLLGGSTRFLNSSGREFVSRQFVVSDLVFGGHSFGVVEGSESLFDPYSGPPDRNGYIGFGLLRDFLVVLDYPTGHIRIYASGDDRAIEAECGTLTFPVEIENGIVKSLAQTENGGRWLLWDTGSTVNMIKSSLPEATTGNANEPDAGPSVVYWKSISIGPFNLGPAEFQAVSFSRPPVDGVIGTPFFLTHRVCLDLPKEKGAIAH